MRRPEPIMPFRVMSAVSRPPHFMMGSAVSLMHAVVMKRPGMMLPMFLIRSFLMMAVIFMRRAVCTAGRIGESRGRE